MSLRNKFSFIIGACVLGSVFATSAILTRSFSQERNDTLQKLQLSLAQSSAQLLRTKLDLFYENLPVTRSQTHLKAREGDKKWVILSNSKGGIWLGRYSDKKLVAGLNNQWLTESLLSQPETITSILYNGRVLVSTGASPPFRDQWNKTQFPMREVASNTSVRFQSSDNREYFGTFIKFQSNPEVVLSVVTPWILVKQSQRLATIKAIWIASFILILSIFVGILFSATLTGPLEVLSGKLREVAAGNFSALLPLSSFGQDEVGHLAFTFNCMLQELGKTRDELKKTERLAALGMFSAGIAHEIRNPLGGVLANAQLIQRQLNSSQLDKNAADESIQLVIDETLRANRIVGDLMKFARRDPTPRLRLDLSETLKKTLEFLKPVITKQSVSLETSIPNSVVTLGNSDQIHEVITNLVHNALHAMKERENKILHIELKSEKNKALIEITDTGHGISEETQKRLFEPFFTTKKIGEGTGLGLAICHGIISNHRGEITVFSTPGKGTTFTIGLPLD